MRGEAANDDPHTLSENGAESLLHIRYAFCSFVADPEILVRWYVHGYVKHNEGIEDQDYCGIGNPFYRPGTEVLVDNIGQDKLGRLYNTPQVRV